MLKTAKGSKKKQGKPLIEVFAQEEQSTAAAQPEAQSDKVQTKKIEHLELLSLKPIATNPRRHSRENVTKIARSIQTYGWTTPVLITDGLEVIAGHGRLLAAEQLGQTHIPCIRLSHLTPELVDAYRIADNRLALDSEWDDQLLTEAIRRLSQDPGFDLRLTGFDQTEIDDFLFIPEGGLIDENAVPPPEPEVISVAGDIWQLGDHRLMCGDSTKQEAVSRLLEGAVPLIMITDPPYGVDYDPTWRDDVGEFHHGFNLIKPKMRGLVTNDNSADWSAAWLHFPGRIIYVWHSALRGKEVAESLEKNGFKIRCQIIWVKSHSALSRGDYHWKHEPCWYAVKGTGQWLGDRTQTSVWEIDGMNPVGATARDEADVKQNHGAQKPVECMRRPLLNHTSQGELAYDPFMGSGTTIIAAQSVGRRAYGLEINPGYVDIAVRRWQAYTGNVARLAGSGETFEEMAKCRKKVQ